MLSCLPDHQPVASGSWCLLGPTWRRGAVPLCLRCFSRAASSRRRQEVTIGRRRISAPALTLGHTTPNSEFDVLVESLGQAFRAHGAISADGRAGVLGGTREDQLVRTDGQARRPRCSSGRPAKPTCRPRGGPDYGYRPRPLQPPSTLRRLPAAARGRSGEALNSRNRENALIVWCPHRRLRRYCDSGRNVARLLGP